MKLVLPLVHCRIQSLKVATFVTLGVAALVFVGLIASTGASQANLLQNPKFDNGLSSWSVSAGTAAYSVDTSGLPPQQGCCSVHGVETNTGSLGRLSQDVTHVTSPGNQYRISGWIKTANVFGYAVLALDYVGSNGATPADGYVMEIGYVNGTQDWTFYQSPPFTLPTMPGDTSATWFLFDFNDGKGSAWWAAPSLDLVSPSSWVNVTSSLSSSPSTRTYASSAYDTADNYTLLFGGAASGPSMSDTWEFSNSGWKTLHTSVSPPARSEAAMAYDANDGYILLFGGTNNPGGGPTTLGDTWKFSSGQWTQLNPPVSPLPRSDASMIYDAADQYILLFGGAANAGHTYYGDTWIFKGGIWSQLTPAYSPSPRGGQGMAYDSADGYAVLFGGSSNFYSSGAGLNDTWEFHAGSWTPLTPFLSPDRRDSYSITYDSQRSSVVLFGGWIPGGACGNPIGDTWEFSGGTWSQPSLSSSPGPRQGAALDYDSSLGTLVLFGGQENPGSGPSLGCGTPAWEKDTWELGSPASPNQTPPVPTRPWWEQLIQPLPFIALAATIVVGGTGLLVVRRRSKSSAAHQTPVSVVTVRVKCPNCGTEFPLQAKHCGNCGTSLKQ